MSSKFYCPMHPEVISDKPSRCPKCGMELFSAENPAEKVNNDLSEKGLGKVTWKNYLPLLIIVILISGVSKVISFNDYLVGNFSIFGFIEYFMIGFFLIFGGFKLLDLRGFAEGYRMYDLLAKKVPT